MRLLFLGGVRTVTGSMHVLEMKGHRLLLECGLFQGHRKESILRNRILPFPFDVDMIDSAVLSHAHIDHAGNFPTLAKKGFNGNIFSTPATRDLSSIMLMDSAYIQAADAEYLNKHELYDPDFGPVDPIYDEQDVLKAMGQFVSVDYHRNFDVAPNVQCRFLEAGHVLGSAIVQLDVKTSSGKTRIAFTGDLGRQNMPLMRNPEPSIMPNYLIIESTYGDRQHEPISTMKTQLSRVVNETFARRGKVIIPSFSLERTQLLVFILNQLFLDKQIPEMPVYVDSPLSVRLTDIFKVHPDILDEEVRAIWTHRPSPAQQHGESQQHHPRHRLHGQTHAGPPHRRAKASCPRLRRRARPERPRRGHQLLFRPRRPGRIDPICRGLRQAAQGDLHRPWRRRPVPCLGHPSQGEGFRGRRCAHAQAVHRDRLIRINS
ncbi:MAG: MBL fold metallo-hydrolase [Deltaproteobacteria bacterium]|nr:MBL fold metallo-hydrolase [Deltaproteobacteria bacterium]